MGLHMFDWLRAYSPNRNKRLPHFTILQPIWGEQSFDDDVTSWTSSAFILQKVHFQRSFHLRGTLLTASNATGIVGSQRWSLHLSRSALNPCVVPSGQRVARPSQPPAQGCVFYSLALMNIIGDEALCLPGIACLSLSCWVGGGVLWHVMSGIVKPLSLRKCTKSLSSNFHAVERHSFGGGGEGGEKLLDYWIVQTLLVDGVGGVRTGCVLRHHGWSSAWKPILFLRPF
jgi:hypothetical protein